MKPVLIAECCQNHNGDRDLLQRMIHAAVENGADYVKIQAINSSEVSYRERFENGEKDENGEARIIKRPYQAEFDRLSKLDLTPETEEWFILECLRAGVAPLTTVFTLSAVKRLAGQGYEAIKVASYDCASFPLLREIRKHWSKLFVSTGATYNHEIAKAAEILQGVDYTFLHCVTIYPTPLDQLHLRRINWLRRFSSQVGYSDHSAPGKDELWASKLALGLGASCVERHFTILDSDQTRDGPVSVTPKMFKELRRFADLSRFEQMAEIREQWPSWAEALGSSTRELSRVELLNRDYYAGRFVSKIDGREIYNWEDVAVF